MDNGDPFSKRIYKKHRSIVKLGCAVQLHSLIKIQVLCREICFQEQGLVRCLTYVSQTEQWWQRSGFITWQRSQNLIAEDMEIKTISCPRLHLITFNWQTLPFTAFCQMTIELQLLCKCTRYWQVFGIIALRTSWLGACENGKFLGDIDENLLLNIWPFFHLIPLFISVW